MQSRQRFHHLQKEMAMVGTIILLLAGIFGLIPSYCFAASQVFSVRSMRGDGELKSAGSVYGQYTSDKTQEAKSFNKGTLGGGKRGYEYVLNSSKSPGKRGARGAVDGDPDDGSIKGNTFTTTVHGETMRIGQTYDGNYQIYKAYLSFNTSAIPSDAVIKSVDLIFYGEGVYMEGDATFNIQVVKSVYTDPLWNPDWGAITSGPLGSLPVSLFKSYNGIDPDSGKNVIHIVGVKADSLINQGGVTRMALVSSRVTEVTNVSNPTGPAGDEYVTISSSDATNKDLRPLLRVHLRKKEAKGANM